MITGLVVFGVIIVVSVIIVAATYWYE